MQEVCALTHVERFGAAQRPKEVPGGVLTRSVGAEGTACRAPTRKKYPGGVLTRSVGAEGTACRAPTMRRNELSDMNSREEPFVDPERKWESKKVPDALINLAKEQTWREMLTMSG